MVRLTLKNLWSHKGRLFLTTLAVTLGVTFVTAAFILTDSLNKTFDELAQEIAGNLDIQVRAEDYNPRCTRHIPLERGIARGVQRGSTGEIGAQPELMTMDP